MIARTERRLRGAKLHYGHGTDNPRDEAAWLVLRGLGLPFDADLSQPAPKSVEQLVARRIQDRIPLAYLLGEAWLDGVPFHVDRRVIVPRSHIPFVLRGLRTAPRRILDLCTGSGCLAILAARAFPRARVDAGDLSASALEVARRNVARHGLGRRIRVVRSDLFTALPGRYDLILSNPPYVATAAMRSLPPEYRYEPGLALAGGRDGLELVSRILAEAPAHLTGGGMLVCEVGEGRKTLERAYPRLPLAWPTAEVFILSSRPSSRRSRAARDR